MKEKIIYMIEELQPTIKRTTSISPAEDSCESSSSGSGDETEVEDLVVELLRAKMSMSTIAKLANLKRRIDTKKKSSIMLN